VKKLLSVLIVLMLISCKPQKEKIPGDILVQDEMVHLLGQIHIAQAAVTSLNLQPDSAKKYYESLKAGILKKDSVSKPIFSKSYHYYTNHPQKMKDIYTKVLETLTGKGAEATQKINK